MSTIKRLRVFGALLGVLLLTGCSAARPAQPDVAWDPIEPVNRGVFWFNKKFDRYLLEPVSQGYDYVTPEFFQRRVSRFFKNLKGPSRFVNALLQLKPDQASREFGRFVINTSVGLAGLFDVASEWGVNSDDEDMGQTFASFGLPAGPYLMLPFLGPSNLRDGFGRLGDAALDPTFYLGSVVDSQATENACTFGLIALDAVQTRVDLKDAFDAARESSLDEYLFIQSAYYQHRNGKIYGSGAQTPGSPGESGETEPSFD